MWITLTSNKAIYLISLKQVFGYWPTFMGQKSKVDAIIDKEEVMKDLSGFLLDSKDAF